MSSTAEQMRNWTGPAIFSFGFRPFFLGAAAWAAVAMTLWIFMLAGVLDLPTRFDPVSWHAHEFLFGYLAAVVAGFILTAVPNWTGRLPIVGWPLAALFALWLAGRLAVLCGGNFPALSVAMVDLAMPVALFAAIGREIIRGRNWRNLPVLAMIGVFAVGNGVFHWNAAQGDYAAQGAGLRIGLGAVIMMIAVIGGRIVPSFTRNWLVRQAPGRLPVPPMQRFDKASLLLLLVALVAWVLAPLAVLTAGLLIAAGLAQAIRLSRWAGERTLAEPLLWILHLAFAFVPLGAVAVGVSVLWPDLLSAAGAQHLWMAGAVGLMTLAVMSRATLGHTGQELTAGWGTLAVYLCMLVATLVRLVAALWPEGAEPLLHLAGLAWLGAFGGFAALYGPAMLRARPAR
ncbi:NnrS family protein [Oceaniglobus trochenteri]|uniref:NnrS family protein n=1 Tax=Oceaniglobus trochenteri TaxID=2763260 RepID=UPI001CFF77CC|nr:NnrS family protein [Oceaniglobus trochenteri]